MFERLLHTRIPSLVSMLAFSACCLMICVELMGARDTAQLTPEILRGLVIWGSLAILWMLVFCLCLAKVTRYRRSLADKPSPIRWSRSL
jgi:type VI protein secretion system component VasK